MDLNLSFHRLNSDYLWNIDESFVKNIICLLLNILENWNQKPLQPFFFFFFSNTYNTTYTGFHSVEITIV